MEAKDPIIYDEASKELNGEWQHLVEHCVDLYEDIKSSEYRKAKIKEIEASIKAYEQKEDPASFPWDNASNIVLPLTTITVDNLEPRLVSGLIGRKPYVRLVLEGDKQQPDDVQTIEDSFNAELEHVVKIEDHARTTVHKLCLEGTVFPIADYDTDDVIRRDFVFDQNGQVVINPETGTAQTQDRTVNEFEGGKIDYAEFTDIFVPDNADEWESTPVIHLVRPTYAELMRLRSRKGYMNIGKWLVKEAGDSNLTDEQQTPSQGIEDVKVTGKKTIECIQCCLSYIYQEEDQEEEEIEDFKEERIVALIALEKKILLRLCLLRELNFKNEHRIKRIRLFPEKKRAYGTSVYGKMKSIQNGASGTFNRVMNNADVTMVPWFIYSDKAGLPSDIIIKPGVGVKVDDPSQVVFPKFNLDPKGFIEFINLWIALWERLVSIGDMQVGRLSEQRGKDVTATEVMAVIQEGNVKHNYQMKTFREEFLTLIRTIYDLYYQFMPFDKVFIIDDKQVRIPRQSMNRPYKFRLSGSTEIANKLIERKENEDFATISTQNPVYQALTNHIEVYKDLLQSYGRTQTDKYINPDVAQIIGAIVQMPQLMPVIQQAIQQAVQQAQEIEQGTKQ